MTSPSKTWEAQEQARMAVWPSLFLHATAAPIMDDGRGEILLDREVPANNNKNFTVVHWSKLAMLDWDLQEGDSPPDVNKFHPGELGTLKERLADLVNAGYGFRFYRTPGGYRGFLTSHEVNLKEWLVLGHYLHVDIRYMSILVRRHQGLQRGWACRVSPKPNREGDYVARLLSQLGPISPALEEFVQMHDALVGRYAS